MTGSKTLIWFRNDLRITNNPALFEAIKYVTSSPVKHKQLIGLIVSSPYEWRQVYHWGLAKADYWLRSARELQYSLAELNIPLLVHCIDEHHNWKSQYDYFSALAQQIVELCQKYSVSELFHNLEYDGASLDRDRHLHQACDDIGIGIQTFHDQCAVPVGKLTTKAGTPFKVFTQFKKAWVAWIEEHGLVLTPTPLKLPVDSNTDNGTGFITKSNEIPIDASGFDRRKEFVDLDLNQVRKTFPAGHDAAQRRLREFLTRSISNYHVDRNHFSDDGASRLSAPLAVGAISLMECLLGARQANNGQLVNGLPGLVSWINELCWRDFYRHVLVAFPSVAYGHSFRSEYERLAFNGWPGTDGEQGPAIEEQFQRWCQGQTGVPIVDAAMRQLGKEAWQSNRLRMIVAMYLTKDLLIHWRRGERHFQNHLIDYDYASNNGGWQWSASTGTDAQPYFRIFNPLLQSEKFDPTGDYIRLFVKELKDIPAPAIHEPHTRLGPTKFKQLGYPLPMIDHKKAKDLAIALFTSATKTDRKRSAEGINQKDD